MIKPKAEGGLGFRDIHGFNMAMLCKQAWRLLHNQESPCARVLQAKYFPGQSCLQARPIQGMSYTWRSILKGFDLLKQGLIWRIGDGTNLRIWSDPWIPRSMSRKPITPRGSNLMSYVAELMDPYTGSWDEQMVRDTFWEEDAQLILAIPIHAGMQNRPAWHFDKKGIFSVKSAYKVFRANQVIRSRSGGASSSNPDRSMDLLWRNIWNTKCANKVKHFIWHLCHNSHPLRMNLQRRGMTLDTRCVVCNRLDEDGGHLFLKCKSMVKVWELLDLSSERDLLAAKCSAREVVEAIMNMNDEKKLLCCLTL